MKGLKATFLRLIGAAPEPAQFIYLEELPHVGRFKYRGKVEKRDDPAGFARMMAKHGLRVIVADTFRGLEITDANAKVG